jgi:hypothetical protein
VVENRQSRTDSHSHQPSRAFKPPHARYANVDSETPSIETTDDLCIAPPVNKPCTATSARHHSLDSMRIGTGLVTRNDSTHPAQVQMSSSTFNVPNSDARQSSGDRTLCSFISDEAIQSSTRRHRRAGNERGVMTLSERWLRRPWKFQYRTRYGASCWCIVAFAFVLLAILYLSAGVHRRSKASSDPTSQNLYPDHMFVDITSLILYHQLPVLLRCQIRVSVTFPLTRQTTGETYLPPTT